MMTKIVDHFCALLWASFLAGMLGGLAVLLVLAGWLGWQWRRHGP